jgi:hypothetical protein
MPLLIKRYHFAALVLSILLCASLACTEEDSGTWRGKWWNYYERGLVKGESGDWSAARSDFAKAIDLRDKDQLRARTYGMHFVDYFPHRELGITLYQLGDLTKAMTELETSYKSEESAKAAFYLNKVRGTLLKQQSANTPPAITIASPANGQAFKDASVTVRGHAASRNHVASVRINGRPYRYDLAREGIDFSLDVPLEDDATAITVEATDLTGKVTQTVIPITVDREGPSLSLSAISRTPGNANSIQIKATLADATGIREVLVNGVAVAGSGSREMTLDTSAVLTSGSATIRIEATDLLGNQTSLDLNPDRDRADLRRGDAPIRIAMNGPGGIFSSDKEAPVISLKDTDELPAVFIDRFYVEGEAFDNNKVERIFINGKEIQIAKGKKVFFSKMVKLKEGANKISVDALDGSGNKNSASFTVKRIVPSSRQASARMSLSILPFNGKIKNATVQDMADDFLAAALIDQKRFQVVEREKLKQILQEQKLAKEKLTDPEHSIQVGRLMSADAMLATTITEGQKSVEIISRLINTETAEVMETKDAYVEDKSLAAVKELMEGLAAKLTLSLPVVEGIVVKREKGTVFSDIGKGSGVRTSMGAAIYRRGKEIKHPVSGKSLGWDMVKIGDGTFEDVEDGFSKIRLHDKTKQPQDIQAKDIVITR